MPALREVINAAHLSVSDGVPLVWLARYMRADRFDRVTGADLIELSARLSAQEGWRIFLLGGSPEALEGTRRDLERRFPGVNICGSYSPPIADYPFPESLDNDICDRVREAAPHVLFVGFGCPKQDLWIRDHLEDLNVPVSIGIGGAFNFFAGLVPRAPERVQRLGLEWLYRLSVEPRRLWRRYLAQDLPFVFRLVLHETMARIRVKPGRAIKLEAVNPGYEL